MQWVRAKVTKGTVGQLSPVNMPEHLEHPLHESLVPRVVPGWWRMVGSGGGSSLGKGGARLFRTLWSDKQGSEAEESFNVERTLVPSCGQARARA